MKLLRTFAFVCALTLAAACGKAADPLAALPSAAPPAVLLTASVDSTQDALTAMGTWGDAVQPGMGRALGSRMVGVLLARAVGAERLDGVDLAGTLHLIVVDSESARGLVAVLRVSDATALEAGKGHAAITLGDGWAAIGPPPAVDAAAAWAFANLCSRPAPKDLTVVDYTASGLARYRDGLAAVRARLGVGTGASPLGDQLGMQKILGAYVDAVLDVLGDTDRVVATLSFHDDVATIDAALVPRPGTALAQFQAAQRPADYALVGQLPDDGGALIAAGLVSSGPYHEAMISLVSRLLSLQDPGDETIAAMRGFVETVDGSFAASVLMSRGLLRFDELAGVSDEGVAAAALRKATTSIAAGHDLDFGGVKAKMTGQPDAGEHDGVEISGYSVAYDLTTMPDAQRAAIMMNSPDGVMRELFAVFDKHLAVHMGGGAEGMGRLIDAARGKGPTLGLSDAMKAAVADSRERAESVIMMLDLPAFVAAITGNAAPGRPDKPLVIGFGAAGGALHLRVALASSSVAGLKDLARPH